MVARKQFDGVRDRATVVLGVKKEFIAKLYDSSLINPLGCCCLSLVAAHKCTNKTVVVHSQPHSSYLRTMQQQPFTQQPCAHQQAVIQQPLALTLAPWHYPNSSCAQHQPEKNSVASTVQQLQPAADQYNSYSPQQISTTK
ncbi:uncharacterized protein [Spinacia oleracea]|uniref:MADS-box domain-containing protein n=1 Tax=Spinacia oleracea TaxID=3562 RepID=A0A9R0J3L8_SPIOL|nr:uncharacterized protein LOC110799012 [Spinacia oleracea]